MVDSASSQINQSTNLHARMLRVAAQVERVIKDTNVNNQYTAVSHDAVVAAVRPFLIKEGILVVTDVVEHEFSHMEKVRNGAVVGMIYFSRVKCNVAFVNAENPDEKIQVYAHGLGMDDQDKSYGKAVSYAKKYALLLAFLLEDWRERRSKATGPS